MPNKIFPQNISILKKANRTKSNKASKSKNTSKANPIQKPINKPMKINKDKKYIIGDYVDHNIRVISFTTDSFTIYENQESNTKIIEQTVLDIDKGLMLGKWKTYKYTFDRNIPNTIFTANGNDVYYNSLHHSELANTNSIYYMLIKLNNNHYLSLGYIMFEFNTPNNDIIIKISDEHSKSGNQNIRFIGEKYSYAIDDGTNDFAYNYYISNDDMKKYNLKNLYMDVYMDANIHKPYFNSYKKENKLFKIKYKVFDVIHILDNKIL